MRIILPLAAPGVVVVFIYSFLMTWGNFESIDIYHG
jgi:ABC-type glycerol-3-phosphate transport system permease component